MRNNLHLHLAEIVRKDNNLLNLLACLVELPGVY